MPSSCSLLLLICDRKVIIPPPSKCKHCVCKSKKQPDLNSAAAAATFGLSTADFADSGSTGLSSLTEFAATASPLSVASIATASAPSRNSVRNCVDFLQSWLILPKYQSCSSIGFFSIFYLFLCFLLFLYLLLSLYLLGFSQLSCKFERFL